MSWYSGDDGKDAEDEERAGETAEREAMEAVVEPVVLKEMDEPLRPLAEV